MLVSETEVIERLESPLNLLNRLREKPSVPKTTAIPCLPSASDLIPDLDEKIAFGSAKSKALNVMNSALDELSKKVTDVSKPKELANIVVSMAKVMSNTQIQYNDNRTQAQIIVYAPELLTEDDFDEVDISDRENA